ncbi:MAG: tetratricopeptide repeat protein [Lachnospiraceae bacterium]|nr:tetratricopeptide repeat protein [Lachnospiraceae bacterium]
MKKFYPSALLAMACIFLVGCGSVNTKTEEGMQQISALQYSDALVLFDDAQKAGENPRLIARGRGIAYLGQTDYEAARDAFLESLSLSKGIVGDVDFDINYYLADAYIGLGDYESAEETYTAIIGLEKEPRAYYLRGKVRLLMESYTLAKEDFDRAVQLSPKDIEMFINIYKALADNGYTQAGEEYLNFALSEGGKTISSLNEGKIYYYLGRYQTAAASLEEARSANGDDAEASLYLGRSYEAVGEYNYASNVYESYLARKPDAAAVYNQLALCKMAMGDYEGALESIQSGMQTGDQTCMKSLSFNEIVAYEYLGEFKKAQALINAYLDGYPADEEALREQIFLQTR